MSCAAASKVHATANSFQVNSNKCDLIKIDDFFPTTNYDTQTVFIPTNVKGNLSYYNKK